MGNFLGQVFHVYSDFDPTKISLFLSKSYNSEINYFNIKNDNNYYVCVDSINFIELEQGDPNIIFDNSDNDFYGNGYIYIKETINTLSPNYGKISYNLKSEKSGIIYSHIRAMTGKTDGTGPVLGFELFIDDIKVDSFEFRPSSINTWETFEFSFVLPDTSIHKVSVRPITDNYKIDSFAFSLYEISPTFVFDQFPYLTGHIKIYKIDDNYNLLQELPVYINFNTSIDIIKDGWHNFYLNQLPGNTKINYNSSYALILHTSLPNDYYYLSWDTSEQIQIDPYMESPSIIGEYPPVTYNLDFNNSQSIRLYSDRDSFDYDNCSIVIDKASDGIFSINNFNNLLYDPIFYQTKVTSISSEINKVELSLPDKIVSFVIDQSGSMTWNDSGNFRFDILNRFIDILENSYPGNIKYNVFSFGSSKINTKFFGVVNPNSDNNVIEDVRSEFILDKESKFSGIRLLRKEGSYPQNPLDGDIVVDGIFDRVLDENLSVNTNYFYKIYTYDSDFRFSNGKELNFASGSSNIPDPITNFKSSVLIGSGTRIDDNTTSLWHLDEREGIIAIDFSSNQNHLTSNVDDIVWLLEEDVPVGISGVRFSGSNSFKKDNDIHNKLKNKLTISAWIYPFDFDNNYTIIARQSNSSTNYILYTNTNAGIGFSIDGSNYLNSNNNVLNNNEWNHISVTVDIESNILKFYVNGIISGTSSFSSLITDYSSEMSISIGEDQRSVYDNYFGKITDVAIHNIIRSSDYINDLSNIKNVIVSSDEDSEIKSIIAQDNGDRIVKLEWAVPENFNFKNGSVVIVEKDGFGEINDDGTFGEVPYHENDGSIIYDTDAEAGRFFLTVSKNFNAGSFYYYKIFSKNIEENFSKSILSPVEKVFIPNILDINNSIDQPSPKLARVINERIISGNKKSYLTWNTNSSDDRVNRVRIFYSTLGFPIFKDNKFSSDSELIFEGGIGNNKFVHRGIENDRNHYYAIASFDKYGYSSDPVYLSSIPSEDADESLIDLLEVDNFSYEIIGSNSSVLSWNLPINETEEINAYFGENINLIAQITDDFGISIDDVDNLYFSSECSAAKNDLARDVFSQNNSINTDNIDCSSLFRLTTSSSNNGIIKGNVRLVSNSRLLSEYKNIKINIFVNLKVKDQNNPDQDIFSYRSKSININFSNPWEMEVSNLNNEKVRHDEPPNLDLSNTSFSINNLGSGEAGRSCFFDGCYVRRENPLTFRVKVSYKGNPVPDGTTILASVHDASPPKCPDANNIFSPRYGDSVSKYVNLPSSSFATSSLDIEENGIIKRISYVDIPVFSPKKPGGFMLVVKSSFNGYVSRKNFYFIFENTLRLSINANPPVADCIDVKEFFANVWNIDPNNPSNKIRIPDLQIVKWRLDKGITGKDRPFYSTESIDTNSGVLSFVRNGTARKVFFGPACDVKLELIQGSGGLEPAPEIYGLRASVSYDGLEFSDAKRIEIEPFNDISKTIGNRFLMAFPSFVNELWADGIDNVKLTITHNSSSASNSLANCFRQCAAIGGSVDLVLHEGQNVNINSSDSLMSIMWGNVSQIFDESINDFILKSDNKAFSSANILLSNGQTTDVYFSINKTNISSQGSSPSSSGSSLGSIIGRGSSTGGQNICPCLKASGTQESNSDVIVIGETTAILNNKFINATGGGSFVNGIPPTVIRLREPLEVNFVGIRNNNNNLISNIIVDGVSENELLVEVSFSGEPVPDGTQVELSVISENSIIKLDRSISFTQQINDPFLNPTGQKRSIAKFRILPIQTLSSFSASINAKCSYDKLGSIQRNISDIYRISYSVSDPPSDTEEIPPDDESIISVSDRNISEVYSGKLLRYNIFSDNWQELQQMKYRRGAMTLNWVANSYGEKLYAIGGIDGFLISSVNEMYDIVNDSWVDVEFMPTPRFYHMSIAYGSYVYVFGGISIDNKTNSSLKVISSVERYDSESDSWETMASMPNIGSFEDDPYGIAMGCAVLYQDKVYILGGFRTLLDNSKLSDMNDRVLIYDISENSWSYTDIFSEDTLPLYQRLSPFYFIKGNEIFISGGAAPFGLTDNLKYLSTAFKYNIDSQLITINDNVYDNIPEPRYQGGSASIGNDNYFIGGNNNKSSSLNNNENIDSSSSLLTLTKKNKFDSGISAFGCVSDDFEYVYACGGFSSGRNPGFLKINLNSTNQQIELNGKQPLDIEIELLDEFNNYPNKDIKVIVQGYLVFSNNNKVNKLDLIYPVVFSSNEITISNGIGYVTLLPRSEDILVISDEIREKLGITNSEEDNITKLNIIEGVERSSYSIKIQASIVDDFFFGQNDIVINNEELNNASGNQNDTDENSGTQSSPISANPTVVREGIDVGLILSESPFFNIISEPIPQNPVLNISCVSSQSWIPRIFNHIGDNSGTYNNVISIFEKLKNSTPFGGSPLYDALIKCQEELIKESGEEISKVIYVNTDNEENLSNYTIDEAIDSIQSIDGFFNTPVIINNFSIVFPVTLSALLSRTNVFSLERIAFQTGGYSQTVISSEFIDEFVNNIVGSAAGSVGYGKFTYTIDLNEINIIKSIQANYTLSENTNANWSISVSNDGFDYSEKSEKYSANDEVNFSELSGRFIKFETELTSGLVAYEDEYGFVPVSSPSLDEIDIRYSIPREDYLFLNQDVSEFSLQQLNALVNSTKDKISSIEIGLAKSNSKDWSDYYSKAQPLINDVGKIFSPLRKSVDEDFFGTDSRERLIPIDDYSYEALYGSWDNESNVSVIDEDGNILNSSLYKKYPSKGLIVLKEKGNKDLFIEVENLGKLRLGIKIINRSSVNNIYINGIGYLYNTNVFLPPPISERAPSVDNLEILPSSISPFSKIEIDYQFIDINNDKEDESQTQINWYVNGVEIQYLRNLRSWNDINDPNDPLRIYGITFSNEDVPDGYTFEQYARELNQGIIKTGDTIYYTMTPSDGKSFGSKKQSPQKVVSEQKPEVIFATMYSIKNNIINNLLIDTSSDIVANFKIISDSDPQDSEIIWYVNDIEFKRGKINQFNNDFSNNKIVPGEINSNSILALSINNNIRYEIIPITSNSFGNIFASETFTVQNSIPVVSNVKLLPEKPNSSSNLSLSFTFQDGDISLGNQLQSDQSSIKWYKKTGSNDFEEVINLKNSKQVNSVFTSIGETWYAEVTPFDGISIGNPVNSNTVKIQ